MLRSAAHCFNSSRLMHAPAAINTQKISVFTPLLVFGGADAVRMPSITCIWVLPAVRLS